MDHIKVSAESPVLFFDVSSLIEYANEHKRYSGIQRAVAMVLAELSIILPPGKLFLSFTLRDGGAHRCVSFDGIGAKAITDPLAISDIFFPNRRNAVPVQALSCYAKNPVKYAFHRTRLDIFARLNRRSSFVRLGMTPEEWRRMRKPRTQKDRSAKLHIERFDAVARPRDRLILLDSTWLDRHARSFILAKTRGVEIFTFVHDLIPILQPQTTSGMMPSVFFKWLDGSHSYTDHYIANSKMTCRDLENFLSKRQQAKPVSVVPLAQAGIGGTKSEHGLANELGVLPDEFPELANIMGVNETVRSLLNHPFVLCVGTIEARKNIWRLAAAWKYLIDCGHVDIPRIVFAGRKGWHTREFFDLLQNTGNLYGYVTCIEEPSDGELEFLYRNCQFAVMPSIYEGWGLPVGEALSYGKTAVVSNCSSLPEVGLDLVEYCDPSSVKSIAEAVLRLAGNSMRRSELEQKIKSTRLRTWNDVARDLLEVITSPGSR